jgi:DNA-binding LacI/PurR family transcriptional regulator/signal transduction histidine kinase
MRKNIHKPTIGLLTFDAAGSYHYRMWKDMSSAAANHGMNFVVFCGGMLFDPSEMHRHWNKIYDLASIRNVDGLIVLSAAISHVCGTDRIAAYLKQFDNLPIVSVGTDLDGIPSVLIDNAIGMKSIMEHMLSVHDIKRPLYLKGPENNDESKVRFSVFEQAMGKYGRAIDPVLVKTGNYQYDIAMNIMNDICDSNISFDSIIASNDDMALGALEILLHRGAAVPEKIALCGFDDTDPARYCSIPLTTVSQPHGAIAIKAIEVMADLLAGRKTKSTYNIPSELVIRKSCGCLTREYFPFREAIRTNSPRISGDSDHDVFISEDEIQNLFGDGNIQITDSKWTDNLRTQFSSGIESGNFDKTLLLFDSIVRKSLHDEIGNLTRWHNFITIWHARSFSRYGSDIARWPSIEDFFAHARLLVVDAGNIMHTSRRTLIQQRDLLFILFSSTFSSIINFNHFLEFISSELPKFGVIGAYVCQFEKDDFSHSRLIMYFTPDGSLYWDREGIIIESSELLPETVTPKNEFNFVVEPLLNYGDIIGYIVFQVNEPIEIMENVRQTVSNALVNIMLIQEVLKDKQLKILLKDLELKQHELEKAYQSLKENQENMLIIEKMASLGRMTAGIAHEMNTPIAAIRTSHTEISRLIAEYHASIGDPDINADDHREIAADMRHSLDLADKAAEKAAAFVHGIKSQTRDLDPKDRFRFNAVTIIRESLLLLGHTLKHGKCEAVFEPQKEYIELYGAPGRLAQIITNLVNNSIDACAHAGKGRIMIRLEQKHRSIALSIRDNGCGISRDHMTKIFDPMFTTKPFGVGTGLGLTLVHNIVNGEFGGKIDVASGLESGTIFTIHFPRVKEAIRDEKI